MKLRLGPEWKAKLIKQIPRYMGKLKKPRFALLAVSALVALIISFDLVRRMVSDDNSPNTPRFLIARRDLEIGLPVSFLDFSVQPMRNPNPEAIPDQAWHRLTGRLLRRSIRKDELLSWQDVVSPREQMVKSIPKGMRAYSFKPDEGIALESGDHVDILLKASGHEMPLVLLEDVVVLKTERERDKPIAVAVEPSQIEILEKAKSNGQIAVALRNPEDQSKEKKTTRQRKVELWIDNDESRHSDAVTQTE